MAICHGVALADWLRKLGIDPDMARRVVIDMAADSPVRVYVEQYCPANMVDMEPPPELLEAKIVIVGADGKPTDSLTD